MKILTAILAAFILLIQYPLWLGKGGWLRAWHAEQDLSHEKAKNSRLESRNATLAAEVRDLKQGTEAIEERARYELGMTRGDEVFFQIVTPGPASPPQSPPAGPSASPRP